MLKRLWDKSMRQMFYPLVTGTLPQFINLINNSVVQFLSHFVIMVDENKNFDLLIGRNFRTSGFSQFTAEKFSLLKNGSQNFTYQCKKYDVQIAVSNKSLLKLPIAGRNCALGLSYKSKTNLETFSTASRLTSNSRSHHNLLSC